MDQLKGLIKEIEAAEDAVGLGGGAFICGGGIGGEAEFCFIHDRNGRFGALIADVWAEADHAHGDGRFSGDGDADGGMGAGIS